MVDMSNPHDVRLMRADYHGGSVDEWYLIGWYDEGMRHMATYTMGDDGPVPVDGESAFVDAWWHVEYRNSATPCSSQGL